MFRVEPMVYLLWALLVLTLPLNWLVSAVLAAVFHELCHMAVLKILGGRIHSLTIGLGGAVMEGEFRSDFCEFLCALAGPAGSFLLLAFYNRFPKVAICAGIQGLFNLLPLFPMDGGRMLAFVLKTISPRYAEQLQAGMEIAVITVMIGVTVAGSVMYSLGILPIMVCAILIVKAIRRKRPCKQGENRVQ